MPKINSAHSMNAAGATIDGLPVTALWDGDDAITVTPVEDEGGYLIGADGSGVWSQYVDNSVEINIMLQPASPTHRQLLNKEKRQKVGLPVPFAVTTFNLGGGEAGVGNNFYIKRTPDQNLGKNATVRKWTLQSCDWRDA